MLKKLYAALLFAIVALAAAPHAHAQWTVYDPSNYYENTENYYQLYDANANLLQQYQQAVQQYQLFNQQFTGSNYMSSLTAYSSRSIAPSGTPLATVQDRNGNNLSGSSGYVHRRRPIFESGCRRQLAATHVTRESSNRREYTDNNSSSIQQLSNELWSC
jgi:hypothetical protein